jgi:hypothetical protein
MHIARKLAKIDEIFPRPCAAHAHFGRKISAGYCVNNNFLLLPRAKLKFLEFIKVGEKSHAE